MRAGGIKNKNVLGKLVGKTRRIERIFKTDSPREVQKVKSLPEQEA